MSRRLALIAFLLQLLILGVAPARAAQTNIAATLLAEGPAMPGSTITLAIDMQPKPGWHGYWQNPGDAGQGMTVNWTLPVGAKVGDLAYPVPATLTIAGLMNHVYKTEYALLVPFTVPAGAKPGQVLDLRAKAQWLACTDEICVPEQGELATRVTVGPPGQPDPRFDRWRAALPAPLGSPAHFAFAGGKLRVAIPLPAAMQVADPHLFLTTGNVVDYAAPQAFFRQGDQLVAEVPVARFAATQPGAIEAVLRLNPAGDGVTIKAAPGPVPSGGEALQSGAAAAHPSLLWLVLAALAGGLLLNIMPCVFPILSLKALSLARAGESESQARAEGLAYTAGVIVACLALGGLLLALRAAGQEVGWAFQLQEPLVIAALLLLAVAITANLLGLYEFMVPGFASAGSPQGAFATGLLAAFAATPCTGPFMAAAMGAALLLPPLPALLLFGALGLGIALPFLAIAWVPALRRRMPKPGPWMGKFRAWMALPMGLTALALIWLASRTGGNAFAFALVLLAIIVVAALVLLGRRQRHGLAGGRLWWGGALAVLALAAVGLPGLVRAPASAEAGLLEAQPFSEAALARAQASGKPVFVYMTADWCLSCKVNERVAIERAATRDAFRKAGVIVLRGDWTRRDPAITRFLTAQGAAGVPLYLWYPSGRTAPEQLPQVLGPDSLVELARR